MGRVTFGKNKKREKEQTENMVKTPLVQTTSSSAQTKPDVSLGEKCNLTTFTKQSVLLNATAGGAILTLSTSSSILLVSGTSGALGTETSIGVRVLPSVPMEAVLTTWGCVGGPESDTCMEMSNCQ